ncbi:MAG: hypothetical protein P8L18_12610 [Verrucomicrobiota bacterium]|nr:hypothetical protein [Verrucomicrobiota bacterium]
MSNSDAKPKLDLDLESAFLPAWAQKSSDDNPYAKYEGRDRDFGGGDRKGRRRRDDFGKPSRKRESGAQGRGPRQSGGRADSRSTRNDRRGPGENTSRPGAVNRGQSRDKPRAGRGDSRGFRGHGGARRDRPRRSRQEILDSLPQLKTQIIPEAPGVALLAKRIRLQGRAYPLFDIAGLFLQSPDRYHIRLTSQSQQKDQGQQNIWQCKMDQSVWLSEDDAVQHVLQSSLDTYYSAEKTETDPPKGAFNFVAQCGMSGVVLGPPNYHGYQARLRELHEERFARMDFEQYKSRVKIVQDAEVVQKWLDEQSWTTEYTDIKQPENQKLQSLDEVDAHFRANYLGDAILCARSVQIPGDEKRQSCPPVRDLVRFHVDDQKRFPLQLATELSQQFTRQGLQFFKVNKTVTHVSVSRPHYLDLETIPVSTTVKSIVQFINTTPDCNRSKVMNMLLSGSASTESTVAEQREDVASQNETSENTAAGSSEASVSDSEGVKSGEAKEASTAAETAVKDEVVLTPEQTAVTTDLHWLIHQGHVIEFSNGKLETAKKPKEQAPKKPKEQAPKKQPKPDKRSTKVSTADALSKDGKPSSKSVPQVLTSTNAPDAVKDKGHSTSGSDEVAEQQAKEHVMTPSSAQKEETASPEEPNQGQKSGSEKADPETQIVSSSASSEPPSEGDVAETASSAVTENTLNPSNGEDEGKLVETPHAEVTAASKKTSTTPPQEPGVETKAEVSTECDDKPADAEHGS